MRDGAKRLLGMSNPPGVGDDEDTDMRSMASAVLDAIKADDGDAFAEALEAFVMCCDEEDYDDGE